MQSQIGNKKLNPPGSTFCLQFDFMFCHMRQAVIKVTQWIGDADITLHTFGEPYKKRESRFSSKTLTKSGNVCVEYVSQIHIQIMLSDLD